MAEIDLLERIVAGRSLECVEPGFASTLSDGTFYRLEGGDRRHAPARRWDMTAQRRARRLARAEVRVRIRAIAERKRELQEQRKREKEEEEARQWRYQPRPSPEQKWWERPPPLVQRMVASVPTTTPRGMEREERVKHVAYVNSVHTTRGYYAYKHHGFWYAKRNTETTGVFGTRGLAEQWLRQEFPAVMELDETA